MNDVTVVAALPGRSRTIVVEPLQVPGGRPGRGDRPRTPQPAPRGPSPARRQEAPSRRPEKVPA